MGMPFLQSISNRVVTKKEIISLTRKLCWINLGTRPKLRRLRLAKQNWSPKRGSIQVRDEAQELRSQTLDQG